MHNLPHVWRKFDLSIYEKCSLQGLMKQINGYCFQHYGGENSVIASLMVVIALQVICGNGVTMISLWWTNTRDSFLRTQDVASLFLSNWLPLSFFKLLFMFFAFLPRLTPSVGLVIKKTIGWQEWDDLMNIMYFS